MRSDHTAVASCCLTSWMKTGPAQFDKPCIATGIWLACIFDWIHLGTLGLKRVQFLIPVCMCGGFPTPLSDSLSELGVLQFHSILTLSTQRKHQMTQVKSSVLHSAPRPFQTPGPSPGCHLSFYGSVVPTSLSLGSIDL